MNYGVHSNEYQGDYKRVLTVCSANMLRSPTIAHVLSAEPYNFNTRSAGTAGFALTAGGYAVFNPTAFAVTGTTILGIPSLLLFVGFVAPIAEEAFFRKIGRAHV